MSKRFLPEAAAVVCAVLMVLPSLAAGEEIRAGSAKAAMGAELITRESNSWRLYKQKDAAALTALTSDDFRDLYSDGEVVDRARWLKDMALIDVDRFKLSKIRAFALSEDSVLMTYQGEAWAHSRTTGQALHNRAAVTSVWARRGGKWLNVFYGETALTADSVFSGAPAPPSVRPRSKGH